MQSIKKVADLLEVSEYKIFSEAYLNWHGDRATEDDLAELFSRFMMFGETPDWVEEYARALLVDLHNNRQINLNSYCVLNMSPRVARKKTKISFSIIQ